MINVGQWYLSTFVWYSAVLTLLCIILQYVSTPESKIRFYASYATFVLWTTTICFTSWPFFLINATGVRNCLYGAILLRPVAPILGIEYELRNDEVLSEKIGSAVVVANHQSYFDVLGMFTQWHVMQRCTAIARKKVFWIWPFGLLAWLAGVVFIDRVHAYEKTYRKINKAAEHVCKLKAKLWMFPEGTRNKNPEKLLPFKKGAFRVAIVCQIPVIPVVYSPYYFINSKTAYFGKGKVIMEALQPIPTRGLTLEDLDDLMAMVYYIMQQKNDELRAEIKKKKALGELHDCSSI